MVVGDDSQSIYSFRGANFKNIMNFPKFFHNVKIIMLEENYRSTQEVLDFGNHVIDAAIEKYPKELFTRKTGGDLPAIISASTENMQSRFIVDRILELREENVPLNDIAVLFRSSFSSFDLEIELNKANIPYQKFGRAHMFAPYKRMGNYLISTHNFNSLILTLMNLLLTILLFINIPKRNT